MAEYRKMTITENGKKLINKQLSGDKSFEFTKIMIGKGTYSQQEIDGLHLRSDLKTPIQEYELTSISQEEKEVVISSIINNENFEEQEIINEIGLYASDGGNEILYSITLAVHPLQIPKYNGEYNHKIDMKFYSMITDELHITLRYRTDIATESTAGMIRASDEITVKPDGTAKINTSQLRGDGEGNIWIEIEQLHENDGFPSVLEKIAKMFNNIRFLSKKTEAMEKKIKTELYRNVLLDEKQENTSGWYRILTRKASYADVRGALPYCIEFEVKRTFGLHAPELYRFQFSAAYNTYKLALTHKNVNNQYYDSIRIVIDTEGYIGIDIHDSNTTNGSDTFVSLLNSAFLSTDGKTTVNFGCSGLIPVQNLKSTETVVETMNLTTQQDISGLAIAAMPQENISNSAAVTVTGKYALDAVQANASVEGTIAAQIESVKNELKVLQYPIGYIFTWEPVAGSPDLSTPQKVHDYYGIGTWELIKDRMLVGAGGSYGISSTGGEAAHALTVAESPAHNHTYSGNTGGNNVDHVHGGNTGTVSSDHVHTGGTTVDGYHAHTFSYRWILGVQTGMSGATASCLTNGNEAAHGTSGAGNHNHTFGTSGINTNHVHGFTTGGQNTGHVHSYSGTTTASGSGGAHNNMPPYRAVYIWKRIA